MTTCAKPSWGNRPKLTLTLPESNDKEDKLNQITKIDNETPFDANSNDKTENSKKQWWEQNDKTNENSFGLTVNSSFKKKNPFADTSTVNANPFATANNGASSPPIGKGLFPPSDNVTSTDYFNQTSSKRDTSGFSMNTRIIPPMDGRSDTPSTNLPSNSSRRSTSSFEETPKSLRGGRQRSPSPDEVRLHALHVNDNTPKTPKHRFDFSGEHLQGSASSGRERSSKRFKPVQQSDDKKSPKITKELLKTLDPPAAMTTTLYGRMVNREKLVYKCGVSASQGPRRHMEDRYCTVGHLSGRSEYSYYGVFDGHGGIHASEFCAQYMDSNLVQHEKFPDPIALKEAFIKTDTDFQNTDRQRKGRDRIAGSTAVAVVVNDKEFWIANVGDSRALLVFSNGTTQQLTTDHKPHVESEKERIIKAGGVIQDMRVNGILSMTRAIGDKMLKDLVLATPDLLVRPLNEDDSFMILGTDGLWDCLSNEQVASIVHCCETSQDAANSLVTAASAAGSTDNITALVIDLRKRYHVPISPKRKQEEKLDAVEKHQGEGQKRLKRHQLTISIDE